MGLVAYQFSFNLFVNTKKINLLSRPTNAQHIYISTMIWSCPKNGRRKITENSIEVDAETKESTRKTEEKLDGRYKEGHE